MAILYGIPKLHVQRGIQLIVTLPPPDRYSHACYTVFWYKIDKGQLYFCSYIV